jgi:hypothetical protein
MRRLISILIAAPLLRVLPTMLLCLTLLGAADAAASDGPVIGWGDDSYGQVTPPDSVNGVSGAATNIGVGSFHSCAIQAGTGAVVCWGYEGHGRATPPDAVNGFSGTATGIAAGHYHSFAIQLPEPSSRLLLAAGVCFLTMLYRVHNRQSLNRRPEECD